MSGSNMSVREVRRVGCPKGAVLGVQRLRLKAECSRFRYVEGLNP